METAISPQHSSTRWQVAAPIACGCVVAAAAAFIGANDPGAPGATLPACPLYVMTGMWCPGCGLTRSTHALLHGDVATAFGFNLLFPLFLGAIVIGWLAWFRRSLGRPPLVSFGRLPVWVPIVLGAVVIGFGVLRNVPGLDALRP